MITPSSRRFRLETAPLWRLLVMLADAEAELGPESDTARLLARLCRARARAALAPPPLDPQAEEDAACPPPTTPSTNCSLAPSPRRTTPTYGSGSPPCRRVNAQSIARPTSPSLSQAAARRAPTTSRRR